MTLRLPARGIYYMLEPILIMLMVLSIFAVPVLQQDRIENSRMLELHANDVMSVMFQSGLVDDMVHSCMVNPNKKFDEVLSRQVDQMVRTLSPVYYWRLQLDPIGCEDGSVGKSWGSQVLVTRTVILPAEDLDNIEEGKLILAILLPAT